MALTFCANRIKFLASSSLYKTCKRLNTGYFVLVPELGEDVSDKDPLMKENGLPEFDTFTVEKVMAAVGKQAIIYEQEIRQIEETINSGNYYDIVDNVMNQLEVSDVRLQTIWGISNTLYYGNQSLMPTRYYETIYGNMIKARSMKFMNATLHKAWMEALEEDTSDLTQEQIRLIHKHIREGKLNGLDLKPTQLTRFMNDQKKIVQRADKIRRMIGLATGIFKMKITNADVVKDFPEEFLKDIAEDSKNYPIGPWRMTLEPRAVETFLTYCPDRELRWNVWQANVGRCSMNNENTLRTSTFLEEIRDYKIDQAKLIGYKSYSHLSMETKMAESLESVYRIMQSLLKIARPAQDEELRKLDVFAKENGFVGELRDWDLNYWNRLYLRSIHNLKDEVLREYFPLPLVINGLFQLLEYLFHVRIVTSNKTDVWHADVQFYDIYDLKESTAEPVAHLYLDPYARGRKKLKLISLDAVSVPIQARSKMMNKKPVVAMIFNFPPPVGDVPSLLNFNDLKHLFFQTGLSLQSILCKVDYCDLAGVSNVEWEAIHLSSNLMVNFLYESRVLKSLSGNYKTGENIPSEMIESIQQSRTHMAGYNLCRELYFSKLDLKLFELEDFWVDIVNKLWKEHFAIPRDKHESHVTHWQSIFVDNYAAANYTFLWGKMLGADAYSAFHEMSVDNEDGIKKTADRYRDTFLVAGGSIHARELYRRFRGRDPNSMAYLNSLGFKVDLSMSENL